MFDLLPRCWGFPVIYVSGYQQPLMVCLSQSFSFFMSAIGFAIMYGESKLRNILNGMWGSKRITGAGLGFETNSYIQFLKKKKKKSHINYLCPNDVSHMLVEDDVFLTCGCSYNNHRVHWGQTSNCCVREFDIDTVNIKTSKYLSIQGVHVKTETRTRQSRICVKAQQTWISFENRD